jgi:hypothetical protein
MEKKRQCLSKRPFPPGVDYVLAGSELNGLRQVFEFLATLIGNEKTNVVLLLVLATFLNSLLTLVVFVRGAYVSRNVDWLLRARRKLAGAAETRLLRDLHARPIPRLLLEGPKNPITSNFVNSGHSDSQKEEL